MGHAKDLRNDVLESFKAHADTVGGELGALAESQQRQLAEIRTDHARQLEDAGASLRSQAEAVEARMAVMTEAQQRQLDEIRGDTVRWLEEARSAVDAKLEGTLERRLGESFGRVGEQLDLVSERLEQVYRGLGEVQTFAAGLGNLQRALAAVRLGPGGRGGQAGAPTAEAEASARGPRKKPRRGGDDEPAAPAS
jgi:DNA recombination protein RmuC